MPPYAGLILTAERKLEPIEARIAEVEQRVLELEHLQADAAVYSDPARAAEVGREKSRAEILLQRLYAEWEAAAASLQDD